MKYTLILYAIALTVCLWSTASKATDFEHFAGSALIAGTLASACDTNLIRTDGKSNYWGCTGLSIIPVIILGAVFEGLQNDYQDAGNDMLMNTLGAITGRITKVRITFDLFGG